MDFLLLATNLALLTYIIGVIVLALPIPYKGIRKWGILLIVDALSAMVLISIYGALLYMGDFILNLLGYSWDSFFSWLIARTGALIAVFGGLSYVSSILRNVHYFLITSPLNLAITYVSLALSALKLIYFLSMVIYSLREKLMLLGLILYSIPFRIGKGVGAFLIAASIIMYVGFPLLPAFIAFLNTNVRTPSLGFTTVTLHVIDSAYNSVPYPIVLMYKEESDEPAARILGDFRGKVMIGDGKDVIPENTTLIINVEFMGYVYVPSPSRIYTKELSGVSDIKLVIENLIYANGLSIIFDRENVYVRLESYHGDIVNVSVVVLGSDGSLTLVRYSYVDIAFIIVDGNEAFCSWYDIKWYDLTLKECRLKLKEGVHNLIIVFNDLYRPNKPSISEKRLVTIEDLGKIFMSYVVLGVNYIYTLVFLPGVYIAFLTAFTTALSRVLGGGIRIKLI